MNRTIRRALAVAALALAAAPLWAQETKAPAPEPEPKKQTVCPIMGGKINPKHYVDVKGKRIYVCCPGCKGAILKDPDAVIRKLEADGIAIEPTPKAEGAKDAEAKGGKKAVE